MSTEKFPRAASIASGSASTSPVILSHRVVVSCTLERACTVNLPVTAYFATALGRETLQEQRRDVVGAAVAVRGIDELGDRALEALRARRDLRDLIVHDHARQAVRAQDVDVAALDLMRANVDLHRLAHAERARDDVLVREVALFFLGHVRLRFL